MLLLIDTASPVANKTGTEGLPLATRKKPLTL